MKTFYVYILTNRSGTLYIGMTSDPVARIYQHRTRAYPGFTSKYHINRLVLIEEYSRSDDAIAHERQLKRWSRQKKVTLIERTNPTWRDLGEDLLWEG